MKDYKDSFLFQVRRIRAKLQKNSKAKNIQQCKSNLVAQRLVSWSHSWSSVFQKAWVHTVYLIDSSWLNSTPATDVGVHSTCLASPIPWVSTETEAVPSRTGDPLFRKSNSATRCQAPSSLFMSSIPVLSGRLFHIILFRHQLQIQP